MQEQDLFPGDCFPDGCDGRDGHQKDGCDLDHDLDHDRRELSGDDRGTVERMGQKEFSSTVLFFLRQSADTDQRRKERTAEAQRV